jgi:hyperosmotically inducible periplasmic protein
MKTRRHLVACTICVISLCLVPFSLAQSKQDVKANQARLAKEVRHELVMLPYYSVFDNLEFQITEVDTVVLSGQVMRPILKSAAEDAIRKLERVGKVINKIEVLPLSTTDDRIRSAAYREIFSKAGLDRYAQMAVPSIHIIVKNGKITLVGIVDKQMDKDLAGMAAQGVPGTFGVTNNLTVKQ